MNAEPAGPAGPATNEPRGLGRLAAWSIRHRAVVDVIVVAWIVGGLAAFFGIRREFFPEISFDVIQVTTNLPGATPEDVERLVTDPLEDAIVDLPGLDRVESVSTEGRSTISVYVDPDAAPAAEVLRDVERAIEMVDDLPADAEKPRAVEIKFEAPVVVVAILSTGEKEAPWEVRRPVVESLKDRIRSIPGVSSVVVAGLRDREIAVEVEPERLAARGLGAADVAEAIRAADADLPAGVLRTRAGEVAVRTVADLSRPESVGAVVVRRGADREIVRVRDVARVHHALADERTRSRIDGRTATVLTVMKSRDADLLEIADRVKALAAAERPRLPPGLEIVTVQDGSVWVRERLGVAYKSGSWGAVLIFVLLALFLDLRSAFWTAYAIPVALLGGILVLHATGGTLNMISIFGFILVIGMLVDDAIVVVENVARHRARGTPVGEAVVRGASEVAWPVAAGVLTTIAALWPLALMSGVMGKFMAEVPKPGIYALAASLLEALLTLPAHLYVTMAWGRPRVLAAPLAAWDRARARADRLIRFLRRVHLRLLVPILRWRYLFLAGIAALFVGSIAVAAVVLRFQLVATRDTPLFMIDIRAPAGASLDEMERIVAEAEARVLGLPPHEVESISSTIGIRRLERGFEYAPEVAQVTVDLHEPHIRRRDADRIMDDLRPRLADVRGAEVVLQGMRGGPPVGRPVSVRIAGDDWDVLRAFADEVKAFIAGLPGARDVEDDIRPGKREAVVRPRADDAARAGTTPGRIALEVRAAADGLEAASVRIGDDEAKIRVRYPPERRAREADLDSIRIPTPLPGPPSGGRVAPLRNVADVEAGRGWAALRHYDGRRTVTVSADLARGGIDSREANRRVVERFGSEARARGLSITIGGEGEETAKSLRSLRGAAWVGILSVAVILVFEFGNFVQPLIVLATLPLAVIGVVATLVVHTILYETFGIGLDAPMGLMPLIGMTALLGVLVNDAIILVDFVNESRRRGAGRWRSILGAGWVRLRPVFLTTATTVGGVLPMAYTLRGSSAFLAPMALVFGWGLALGTVLSLFVVPALTAVVDDVRRAPGRAR